MDHQQELENIYLNRIFEKQLGKFDEKFLHLQNQQDCDNADTLLQQLQYGTVLAKSLAYLSSTHDCRRQLDLLFKKTINEPLFPKEKLDPFVTFQQLRFLVAYCLIDSSQTEQVKTKISTSLDSLFSLEYAKLSDKSVGDRRSPPNLLYEYLLTLTEIHLAFQDSGTYTILNHHCCSILTNEEYHQICKLYGYIGFFAVINTSVKDISKDILIQNLFRTNFLRSALENNPWLFLEQIFIGLTFLPDKSLFHFAAALLIKQIDYYTQSTKFRAGAFAHNKALKLTQVLLYYVKCKANNEKVIHATTKKHDSLLWNRTDNITALVKGKLHPNTSPVKTYSKLTFIAQQIVPNTLFVAPDRNWSKKYQNRSRDHVKPFNLGAETVITSSLPAVIKNNQQFILVPNTFSSLIKLALANRQEYHGKIIGITGSVGKTSTAGMLYDILRDNGSVYKNIALFNHQTGIPKSVANIPHDSDFAILEMGMGRPLSILPKTKLARPHIAIVVEIQHDHMEFHDSIQSVIETKMEIVDGLEPGGTVILNRDSAHFPSMLGIATMKKVPHVITFGEHPHADIRAKTIKLLPDCSLIQLEIFGKSLQYTLSLPGIHMAHNSLAVWAVLYALGLDTERAAESFSHLRHASGRNEIFTAKLKEGMEIQVIDDSFNANPSSMRSSFHLLSLLQPGAEGRRVMIMGDMGELGPNSRKYHEDLAEDINQSNINIVFSVGMYTQYLSGKINSRVLHKHFESGANLKKELFLSLKHGDIIAVKGSARERDMGKIIKELKRFAI